MTAPRLGMRLAALGGIVVAGLSLTLTGQSAAWAGTTSGNGSVGSGNQLVLPVSVPIDLCGNVVAALGLGRAECTGGAAVASGAPGAGTRGGKIEQAAPNPGAQRTGTSGTGGLLSGNQISVPITIPITVCGNAAAVAGGAEATCQSAPMGHASPPVRHTPPARHKPRPRRVVQKAVIHHPRVVHHEVSLAAGILPITGVNLAGMTAAAGIMLIAGAGAVLGARKRRPSRH
jgi:LPXTG-motif cell wall-anchored protein